MFEPSSRLNRYISEAVNDIEASLGMRLPEGYRTYLMHNNGAKPRKTFFNVPGQGESQIHHWYTPHVSNEPDTVSLQEVIREQRRLITSGFLPIADDAFGNQLCLCISSSLEKPGAVFFFDHEEASLDQALIQVAEDFDSFIASLMSESEHQEKLRREDPEGYDEFEQSLEEMRRLRQQELDGE